MLELEENLKTIKNIPKKILKVVLLRKYFKT